MKLNNKNLILLIFTILITLVIISNGEESRPNGVPIVSDPNPTLTTKPTPTPTPTSPSNDTTETPTSTSTPTPTPTPTDTINPYANGKMSIKVNVGSIVNYVGVDCGEGNTPCKSIIDGFKKFINFKNVNSAISFNELEFIISRGVYNKSNYHELATKLNLYDLGVNVSFVAADNAVEFDGTGLNIDDPFAFISTKVSTAATAADTQPEKKVLFYFEGITFLHFNESKLLEISILSSTATDNGLPQSPSPSVQVEPTSNTSNASPFVNVLFKKCGFETINTHEIDLFTSNVDKLGWVQITFEQSKFVSTYANNVFKLVNTIFVLRNGMSIMEGRAGEAFINGVGCLIQIENASFRQLSTREGLLLTVNSSVSIRSSYFDNNYGTFSSIIHYITYDKVDLNITKTTFNKNMVTNNGGRGDSIIIIKNEGPLNQENNKHTTLPSQKLMVNVTQETNKANIVDCTFLNNNTPKSIDSALIWSYNSIVNLVGTDILNEAIGDHGPSIISHQSTFDIFNTKFITTVSDPNKTDFSDLFPHIVSNYSSIRTTNIIISPTNILPYRCNSSLIEFDYQSGVNASLFICDNIHKEDYNSTYSQVSNSNQINSYSCEIIQRILPLNSNDSTSGVTTVSPIPFYPNIVCSNESHHKYKYDFKLTKAVIAIIVIACTLLTLIPVVLLANKIYKNLYRGYAPHESDEQDIEEFTINSGTTLDKGNHHHTNNNNDFQDVSYDDETPNKSLLK